MRRYLLVYLLLTVMVVNIGCSTVKSPDTVTKEFLSALQTGDIEKAAALAESSSKETLNKGMFEDEKSEKFGKMILSKITFEMGTSKVEGEKATVKVKITIVDLVRIATKTMSEMMPMAFAYAFSNDPDSQRQMENMLEIHLENSISDPQVPKVTNEVNVNLVKTGEGWKIAQDNDDLFNAITGNVAKAFK